jgi:hypothetical protein
MARKGRPENKEQSQKNERIGSNCLHFSDKTSSHDRGGGTKKQGSALPHVKSDRRGGGISGKNLTMET